MLIHHYMPPSPRSPFNTGVCSKVESSAVSNVERRGSLHSSQKERATPPPFTCSLADESRTFLQTPIARRELVRVPVSHPRLFLLPYRLALCTADKTFIYQVRGEGLFDKTACHGHPQCRNVERTLSITH